MSRDPAKLSKKALVAELRDKHGVEEVELPVPAPDGFGDEGFEMPEGIDLRIEANPDHDPDDDGSPETVPVFVEVVPLEDAAGRLSVPELAEIYADRLDTTTEEEREEYAREAVERENAAAEAAENIRAAELVAAEADATVGDVPNDEAPGG